MAPGGKLIRYAISRNLFKLWDIFVTAVEMNHHKPAWIFYHQSFPYTTKLKITCVLIKAWAGDHVLYVNISYDLHE